MLSIVVVTSLAGCGAKEEGVNIAGKVTLNGVDIPEGVITFEPVEPNGHPAEALIQQGNYESHLLPGKKVVRIQGFRVVGERNFYASRSDKSSGPPDGPKVPVKEQFVPPKYNLRSELKRDIDKSGGTVDFKL